MWVVLMGQQTAAWWGSKTVGHLEPPLAANSVALSAVLKAKNWAAHWVVLWASNSVVWWASPMAASSAASSVGHSEPSSDEKSADLWVVPWVAPWECLSVEQRVSMLAEKMGQPMAGHWADLTAGHLEPSWEKSLAAMLAAQMVESWVVRWADS